MSPLILASLQESQPWISEETNRKWRLFCFAQETSEEMFASELHSLKLDIYYCRDSNRKSYKQKEYFKIFLDAIASLSTYPGQWVSEFGQCPKSKHSFLWEVIPNRVYLFVYLNFLGAWMHVSFELIPFIAEAFRDDCVPKFGCFLEKVQTVFDPPPLPCFGSLHCWFFLNMH